jgi:putative phosphoribosyl transferase
MSRGELTIEAAGTRLGGTVSLVDPAQGIVVFAHGSGSSRFSPRNRFVADYLNAGGLATLLFDLLTPAEHEIDRRTATLRFDIRLLTERLIGTVDWLGEQADLRRLPIGLFGASTGAAAALSSAAKRPHRIAAVVSRGGRPDLALASLPTVKAPTLLIVGGFDSEVIRMNRTAAAHLRAPCRLEIVPGATHLFEEPGTLEAVARLARDWFRRHLTAPMPPLSVAVPGRGSHA